MHVNKFEKLVHLVVYYRKITCTDPTIVPNTQPLKCTLQDRHVRVCCVLFSVLSNDVLTAKIRLYSVTNRRIRVVKHWWNDTTLVGVPSEDGMVHGEITCECGRNYIGEMGRRLGKRSKNQNIIWKNSTLTSQNVYYTPAKKDTSLIGHGLVFHGLSPTLLTAKYKWLTCYVPAILLVTPVWRYLLFGSLWLGKNSNATELRSFVLLLLCVLVCLILQTMNLACWLFYILLSLFLLNLIYIIWYLDL
jgi:hypothetical protein